MVAFLDFKFTQNIFNKNANIMSNWNQLYKAQYYIATQMRAQRCQSSIASIFGLNSTAFSPRRRAWAEQGKSLKIERSKAFIGVPLRDKYWVFLGSKELWRSHSGQLSGSARTSVMWDVSAQGNSFAAVDLNFVRFSSRHLEDKGNQKNYGLFRVRELNSDIKQEVSSVIDKGQAHWGSMAHIIEFEVAPKFKGRMKTLAKGGKNAKTRALKTSTEANRPKRLIKDVSKKWGI